jgi:hypothetical protein
MLTELATAAGATDPELLGQQLALLYHGGGIEVAPRQRSANTRALRAAAQTLVDATTSDGSDTDATKA